jgi:hypothetical protein
MASVLAVAVAGCVSYTAQQAQLPQAYLQNALAAVKARDANTAIAQINLAETTWLGANTPYGDPQIDIDPEALREIGRARQSVEMGRWGDAEYYVRTALTHPSTIQPIYPWLASDHPSPNGPAAYTAAPGTAAPTASVAPPAPGTAAASAVP